MNMFAFESNAVKTFIEFQARLIKQDTRNVLFPPSVAHFFSSAVTQIHFSKSD
jgi:hypothetical protein